MPAIPPAMNLGTLPVAVPSIMFKEPREGRKSITQVIAWSRVIAKSLTAVNINLQNNATLEFSQICGLIVDNSDCGADLDFIFPDTDVTISIPAYAPYTVLDVATNQTQFFVVAHNSIQGDVTRFSILNFAPPPVAVPLTILQQSALVGSIPITGAGATQIIGVNTNGTLQNINVSFAQPAPAAGAFNDAFVLQDGNGQVIWQGNLALAAGSTGLAGVLANINDIQIRFVGGIELAQTGGNVSGGTLDVNLYYKVP